MTRSHKIECSHSLFLAPSLTDLTQEEIELGLPVAVQPISGDVCLTSPARMTHTCQRETAEACVWEVLSVDLELYIMWRPPQPKGPMPNLIRGFLANPNCLALA